MRANQPRSESPVRLRLILASVSIVASLSAVSAHEPEAIDPAAAIGGMVSELPGIRRTIQKLDEAPEGGMLTLWDKDSYREDLNELLDEAFDLVLPGVYADAKREVSEIDAAIALGVSERSELVVRRETATAGSAELGLLDRVRGREVPSGSKEDLARRVSDMDKQLEALRSRRSERIEAFRNSLASDYGIELDGREAEAALYQVNGENIVDGMLVTKVLIAVESQLRKLVQSDIDPATARRYYGVAAVSRLIIVRTHERHLQNYDGKWLPKLADLERDNEVRRTEIKKTLAKAQTASQKATMGANLKVRMLIGETISSYRKVLLRRQEITKTLLKDARIDAEVAVETLRTLESVAELSSLLDDSLAEFNSVLELKAPDLVPLDDKEMFERFLDLSRQMQGS
jgi:hypothetical protein